jgi:indolepyruvate ferredoxin oxidoreductase
MRAIELNGVAIGNNRRAFDLGRLAAHDLPAALRVAAAAAVAESAPAAAAATTLAEIVALRARFLQEYQDARLATRYTRLVERVAQCARAAAPDGDTLAIAVARNYFKLLAVKDEYEVARLHRDPAFRQRIAAGHTGPYRIHYHLAPPLLAAHDPVTGHARKMEFGPWLGGVFAVLARLRFLRGTPLDPFCRTQERRAERALVAEFESMVEEILPRLSAANVAQAQRMAGFPEEIRGFGHVKQASMDRMRPLVAQWRSQWRAGAPDTLSPAPAITVRNAPSRPLSRQS